jgi:hypothetical protein
MARERSTTDPTVTAFVRKLIEEWPGDLQSLSRASGVTKSGLSQIRSGDLGVGAKTRRGFARAFGFPNEEAFLAEARASYGQSQASAVLLPAQEQALQRLADVGLGDRGYLVRIMGAYSISRFADRSAEWWMVRVLEEVEHDRSRWAAKALLDDRAREEQEMRPALPPGPSRRPSRRP